MRTAHILLLCILGAALLSSVMCNNGTGPDDCCFEFYPRRIGKKMIRSYYMTDHRCTKTGVINNTTVITPTAVTSESARYAAVPHRVSVHTRSVDSDDGTLFGEFCIQLRSDIAYNETNSTDTSEESGPRNFTGHEGSNLTDVIGGEQPATSLQPKDADLDPDLDPDPLSEVVLRSPAAEHKPSMKSETTFHRSHGSDGTIYGICCFQFYPIRINKKLIRSYYMTDHRCTKTGVILVTQKARHFCVDPSLSSVRSLMTRMNASSLKPTA